MRDGNTSPLLSAAVAVGGNSSYIYQSLADARKSWKRATRPASQRCLGDQFRRELSATIRFRRRSSPRVAQRAIEYRLSDHLSSPRSKVGIYIDIVLLKQSRAIVLLFFGSETRPTTLAYEQRLAHLVGRRMRTAMQGA